MLTCQSIIQVREYNSLNYVDMSVNHTSKGIQLFELSYMSVNHTSKGTHLFELSLHVSQSYK